MLYICGRRIKSGFPVCDFEVEKDKLLIANKNLLNNSPAIFISIEDSI